MRFQLYPPVAVVYSNPWWCSVTPMESMPKWLQDAMQVTPTPHFVSFAEAVLFRAAGLDIVWPQLRGEISW